jgi:hypothetical protein
LNREKALGGLVLKEMEGIAIGFCKDNNYPSRGDELSTSSWSEFRDLIKKNERPKKRELVDHA